MIDFDIKQESKDSSNYRYLSPCIYLAKHLNIILDKNYNKLVSSKYFYSYTDMKFFNSSGGLSKLNVHCDKRKTQYNKVHWFHMDKCRDKCSVKIFKNVEINVV